MEFHHVEQEEQQEQEDDEEMPLPLNTTYGHNHIVPLSLHHHKPPGSTTLPPPPPGSSMVVNVKYKECLRNHAASMGGKARDGCGEFMALGEEGTLEALTCSVCNCHRNFHRKEVEADNHHRHYATATTSYDDHHHRGVPTHLRNGRNLMLQGPPPPMIMPYSIGLGMGSFPLESDSQEIGGGGGFMSMYPPPPPAPPAAQAVKKRFRTKFTQEQKERMYKFAEKSGWKIQRQEDSVVEEFCQEIGIKRRVLKVWMHNNKQNLAKNTNSISINNPPQNPN